MSNIDIFLISVPSGEAGFKKSPWRHILSSDMTFGLLTLATYLDKFRINVKVLDASALFLTNNETIEEVKKYNPKVLGISSTTSSIANASYVSEKIKSWNPDIITIVGGPHISGLAEKTMRFYPTFDIGVLGEGELTLHELLSGSLTQPDRLATINGIIYRDGNKNIVKTIAREYIQDVTAVIPKPKWSFLQDFPKAYRPTIFFAPTNKSATIITSRGCPYRCNFCNRSVFGNKYRCFSAEYVYECVVELIRNYKIKYFNFYDDNFTVNPTRLETLCNLIIDNKLNILWSCDAHIQTMKIHLLPLMKKAGCWSIAYGIESGSPRILRSYDKYDNVEHIREVVNATAVAGIRAKGLFMIGSPEETQESVDETVAFIKTLKLATLNLSKYSPYPGTLYYDRLKIENEEEEKKLWLNLNHLNYVKGLERKMTDAELDKSFKLILKTFYNNKKVGLNHFKNIIRGENLIRLFKSIGSLLFN